MFLNNSLILSITILISLCFAANNASANSAMNKDSQWFKHLYEYALFANVAYLNKTEIEKTLASSGYKLTKYGQLSGYEVGYFLATNDKLKQQILVIRGTSNIENAMVDVALNLLPNKYTGIKLHQGFALSADLIYHKIKNDLIKSYRINTTGHSLGGAAALILAMYIDAGGFHSGKVITFGQPKVTNITGSKKYSHLDVTRVVMPKDMVPLVPPLDPMDIMKMDIMKMDLMNMDIYWHSGTEVILRDSNTFSLLKGIDSMMRATDFLNEMIGEKHLQQHYMSLYIKSLSQKLINPQRVPYENNFSVYDFFGR